MRWNLNHLRFKLFDGHWVRGDHLIEYGDVLFHFIQNIVWAFDFIKNAFKYVLRTEVFRVSPLLFWILTFMGWNIYFLVTILFLPIGPMVTPFYVTVSPFIISFSIPTFIPTQPWIAWTKTTSLIGKKTHFLIIYTDSKWASLGVTPLIPTTFTLFLLRYLAGSLIWP